MIWKILFWGSLALIAYTYFGYPGFMWVLARCCGKEVQHGNITPSVSMIITVHNEEKVMRKKLENTLALNYPENKLEVIVASDWSTDGTNQIVSSFAERGVILNSLPRVGKSVAQNLTVPLARGEIIVFSYANSMYQSDRLQKMMRNFADPQVGAVSGRLVLLNEDESSTNAGEGLYWRYENFLRRQESTVWSCIMANASILTLRKKLFIPIDTGFSEDCVLPLWVAADGGRTVFDPNGICC